MKSTKSFVISKDSTCILGSFAFSDRAHPGPWPLACTVIARPAHFFHSAAIYMYITNISSSLHGGIVILTSPTHPNAQSAMRYVGIVYERSQHIRPLNNTKDIATHPKGHGWSSYTPGVMAKQSLKPAHVGFLKKWYFLSLELRFF